MDNKFSQMIKKWNEIGLNIYLALPILELPEELIAYLKSCSTDLSEFKTIIILGNGGKKFGENFQYPLDEKNNPMDSFTLCQLTDLNAPMILYPSENFIPPLQKICRYFGLSHSSPLGLDISNEFGPWFAVRALFLSREEMPKRKLIAQKSPCEDCLTLECLKACPAKATSKIKFNLNACANYRLDSSSKCGDRCLARMACPYKSVHQYELSQIQYHMSRERHLINLSDFKK